MTLSEEYVASLTAKEKQAYEIAKDHLGCLLNIEKTNGYLKWLKDKENDKPK